MASQLKLDLGLEPLWWEDMGWDDYDFSVETLNEDYYTGANNGNVQMYDAWSQCWANALDISRDPKATIREKEFAGKVFQVMCSIRAVPIVSHRIEIDGVQVDWRNQLD